MSYNALIRPLKNGNEYNSLFPTPKEKKVRLGKGDTHTSIELIIKWALENNHEVKLVATKLQKGSLSETCFAIHDFLYNHFQYEADGEAQLLRSPAYAWKHRYEGIDCKSYSVIASCILLQLGVAHYIRKIKQPAYMPESFTHVYVIVPVNQDSGSLKNGYYTIDGTLKSTREPSYIDKKDFFMDKLEHFGLKGLRSTPESPDNPYNESDPSWLENIAGELSFDGVKDYFNTPISCWGGSAFSGDRANAEQEKIGLYFENVLTKINEAVRAQNMALLSSSFNQFEGILFTALKAYAAKQSEGWNKCTADSIIRMQKTLEFYQKIVHVGLVAWLQKYFEMSIISTKVYRNNVDFERIDPAFFFTYTDPNVTYTSNVQSFKLKSGVSQIPAFEFTPYVEQASANPSSFNAETFLQGLSTVLVSFAGGGTGGTGAIDENGQNIYDQNNQTKTTSNAGSFLLGALAFGGLAIWGFSKLEDKGSKTAKKPVK
ncbi:hypothetical protein FLCU109888_11495 [Flavobacterium cucumis]|uniref:Transglutaminase-like superfamily protein n=1 Tax=Flavobacterium cucumis TaxID=416016 RepID=A0A1M7ZVF9_9FLAO|nr:hypothetical protein [Flavobacterium cucumis]SHO72875.1 hypothetical protein SAMN05443547_1219 [Flavobacterium cucumis]